MKYFIFSRNFYLTLFLLLTFIPTVYATDYAYEATKAYHECAVSGKNCETARQAVDNAINYYAPRKHNSYENLRNYCGVLYLRVNAMSWKNMEKFQRDMFEYQKSCQL